MQSKVKVATPKMAENAISKNGGSTYAKSELTKDVTAMVGTEKSIIKSKLLLMPILIFSFLFSITRFSTAVTSAEIPMPMISAFIPTNLGKISTDKNRNIAPTR